MSMSDESASTAPGRRGRSSGSPGVAPLKGRADEIQERFRREAQTLASMRSRHTIAIYDYGVTELGVFYYVMELLDGLDLESLVLRHGPQPAGRVVPLLLQACASLAEAHDAGLLHRDHGDTFERTRGGRSSHP